MRRWIIAILVWVGLFSAVALVALGQGRPHTYYETFDTTTHQDHVGTTALWDTATGQLKLHPPAPVWEAVARVPSSVSPPFQISMGFLHATSLAVRKNLRPSLTPSM